MTLAQQARRAWTSWASYRKWTRCTRCQQHAYCGARRSAGPWLCVDCHDQG